MGTKPIEKIREGLRLTIEGLIEDTLNLEKENGPLNRKDDISCQILGVIEYQMGKVKDYLREVEIYRPSSEELSLLKARYHFAKSKLGLK